MYAMVGCPHCKMPNRVPRQLLGQRIRCNSCGKDFHAVGPPADDVQVAAKLPPVPNPSRPAPAPPRRPRPAPGVVTPPLPYPQPAQGSTQHPGALHVARDVYRTTGVHPRGHPAKKVMLAVTLGWVAVLTLTGVLLFVAALVDSGPYGGVNHPDPTMSGAAWLGVIGGAFCFWVMETFVYFAIMATLGVWYFARKPD